MEHLLDSAELHLPGYHLHLPQFEVFGIDMSITRHVVMMWLAALILIVAFVVTTRRRGLVPSGLSNALEAIVQYIRDEIAVPNIGKNEAGRFMPFLLTVFFFILTCNLLGMIPFVDIQNVIGKVTNFNEEWAVFGGTATSNLAVTAGLAIISFIVIQIHAFKSLGLGGWAKHLTGGAPLYLLPLMLPLEFMGMFIKPTALAIRLFANMVGGHTMLAVLTMFGMMAFEATSSWLITGTIGAVSVIAAVVISFLELFVAFLQAFIFMLLTAVFIAQMSHHDDANEEHSLEPATH